jgi:hypothetical protein
MAKVVSYDGDTKATFELTPEEALEIRKTALMAAVRVAVPESLISDILYTATKFEEHLQRGIDIDG